MILPVINRIIVAESKPRASGDDPVAFFHLVGGIE